MWTATSSGQELRKRFWRGDDDRLQSDTPSPGKLFDYERHEVCSLRDVHSLLQRLADDPHSALVMGKPTIERGERNAAYFGDGPSEFWLIDLDGVPIEGGTRDTIERCLPFLAGKAYVYAFTQSAGLKEGLRCRVACRVPRPLSAAECAAYARHYNDLLAAFEGKKKQYIDPSIYAPSRFVFTARPKLSGIDDPHPERVFYVDGDESPVPLAALPEMVEIKDEGNRITFGELPHLQGDCWGLDGEGHNRSIYALKSLGALRAYMGEAEWEDAGKRQALWNEMLDNVGTSAYERWKYGDFYLRRACDARPPREERGYLVHANSANAVPLRVAEAWLGTIMRRAVQLTEPRVIAVAITMGAGKTRAALKHLAVQRRYLEEISPLGGFNIDYYVPTVQMGEEALRTAAEHGLDGFIEYGRGQETADGPVCIKADSAKKLQGLVDNVAESLCHNKNGEFCEHYHDCRWQWQRNNTQHLPLRIRAHNYLPLTVRAETHEAFRQIDFVVIDEASFVDDLTQVQWVELSELIEPRLSGDDYRWALRFAEIVGAGLTLDRLREAGFTADLCRQLIKAEEALRPRLDVSPNMSPTTTWAKVEKYEVNWHRFASVWRRLRDCLERDSMNRIKVVISGGKTYLDLAWKSPMKGIPWDLPALDPPPASGLPQIR